MKDHIDNSGFFCLLIMIYIVHRKVAIRIRISPAEKSSCKIERRFPLSKRKAIPKIAMAMPRILFDEMGFLYRILMRSIVKIGLVDAKRLKLVAEEVRPAQ